MTRRSRGVPGPRRSRRFLRQQPLGHQLHDPGVAGLVLSHPDFTPQQPPSAEQGCWQRADASEEREALPAVKSCGGEGQAHGCEVSRGGRFHVGKDKRGSGDREDASVSIDWEGSGTAYEGDIRAVSKGTLLWLDACPSSRLYL